jgi:hypothetical protein
MVHIIPLSVGQRRLDTGNAVLLVTLRGSLPPVAKLLHRLVG